MSLNVLLCTSTRPFCHDASPALLTTNAAIDAQWDAEYTDGGGERHPCRLHSGGSTIGVGTYSQMNGGLEWDQPHCLPWRELLVNPGCVP